MALICQEKGVVAMSRTRNGQEAKTGRVDRAAKRQEARDARTPQQQLKVLAARGVTSGREADRLRLQS